MKFKNLKIAFLASTVSLVIVSCGGGEAESTGPKYNYEKADSLPSGYLEELGVVKTNIEMTAQLYNHMAEKGYNFNESILLSSGKVLVGLANKPWALAPLEAIWFMPHLSDRIKVLWIE